MLLRETLLAVLTQPTIPFSPQVEVNRHRQPVWSSSQQRSHALVLTGVRRCGKSTLQSQIRQTVKGKVVTINLEDTRLYGLGPEDFSSLIDILDDRHPEAAIYLDEVQEVPEWERLVRALLDKGRPVCLTGSNASLLSRELGSKLTGRHLSHEVFPFSYREFLEFTLQKAGSDSLQQYLMRGGFAAALAAGPIHGTTLLRELLRDVVQRDIVSRHALRASRPLMNLALHLLAHTGQPLSLQALTKGLAMPSVAQTGRLVEYLQDAWLLLAVPRFSPKFKQRVISPPKYYPVDPGFAAANNPNPTLDLGRRLENVVMLHLRRLGEAPTFAAMPNDWECDFITPTLAIQCCATLTPENRARELRGLMQAASLSGGIKGQPRELLVITLDQEDQLEEQGIKVHVVPAWKWLD